MGRRRRRAHWCCGEAAAAESLWAAERALTQRFIAAPRRPACALHSSPLLSSPLPLSPSLRASASSPPASPPTAASTGHAAARVVAAAGGDGSAFVGGAAAAEVCRALSPDVPSSLAALSLTHATGSCCHPRRGPVPCRATPRRHPCPRRATNSRPRPPAHCGASSHVFCEIGG